MLSVDFQAATCNQKPANEGARAYGKEDNRIWGNGKIIFKKTFEKP